MQSTKMHFSKSVSDNKRWRKRQKLLNNSSLKWKNRRRLKLSVRKRLKSAKERLNVKRKPPPRRPGKRRKSKREGRERSASRGREKNVRDRQERLRPRPTLLQRLKLTVANRGGIMS